MWQEIAVFIIGLIVIFYIGKKIYKFFTHPTGTDNPCQGCPGCALKNKIRNNCKCIKTPKPNNTRRNIFLIFITLKL